MHICFLAKNTVTKTRAVGFLFPGYELANMSQDQHISNLCFLIHFCAHLFQPYAQRKKLHLEEPCIWKTRIVVVVVAVVVCVVVVVVVVAVIPLLAQDLRVHCCTGCRQSGDGRAKKGTEQIALQEPGKQDHR